MTKIIRLKDLRERVDAMVLTIRNESLNPAPLTVFIYDILDSTNNEDDLDKVQCHVCLDSRSEIIALLHDHCVHADFCETLIKTRSKLSNLQVSNSLCFESFPRFLQLCQ